VNAVINLRVPSTARNFLSSLGRFSFSEITLIHVVIIIIIIIIIIIRLSSVFTVLGTTFRLTSSCGGSSPFYLILIHLQFILFY
jgi:hypothetical protein